MKETIKVSKANQRKNPEEFTTESVSIVAISKMYKDRPYYALPIWNQRKSKFMYGAIELENSDMVNAGFELKPDSSITVSNGDVLNLKLNNKGEYIVDRDFILYNLLLVQPEIASSKDDVKHGTSLFYMNNIDRQARSNAVTKRLVAKAFAKLGDCTMSDYHDLLYFFNMNPRSYTAAVVESKCYDFAETQAAKVVEFFEKRQITDRIVFVKKCLANKLLTKDKNGYILYDSIGIGAGEEAAANYLYDQANDRIYTALRGSLDAIEGFKSV